MIGLTNPIINNYQTFVNENGLICKKINYFAMNNWTIFIAI